MCGYFITWHVCLLALLVPCRSELVHVTMWCWIQKHNVETTGASRVWAAVEEQLWLLKVSSPIGIWKATKESNLILRQYLALIIWAVFWIEQYSEVVNWFAINSVYSPLFHTLQQQAVSQKQMGWDSWEQIFTQYPWSACKQALLKISWVTTWVNVFKHLLSHSLSGPGLSGLNSLVQVVAGFWHIWRKHLWQPVL